MSSCHWKTIVLFCLQKKRPEYTNSELSQNRTEKEIISFKTTVNWLFNDIWCYSVMGCFDWKINVFQQTVKKGFIVSLI